MQKELSPDRNSESIYLRMSVTDVCNLHCSYCNPSKANSAARLKPLPLNQLAELAELINKTRNIRKIRITGGEPLLRDGIIEFIADLKKSLPHCEISLTTNGLLLSEFADSLKRAGLTRINVSIDSPDEINFNRITGGGELQKVIAGIEAASDAGFSNTKINTVLMKSCKDNLGGMIRLAKENNCFLRFIELMPIGNDLQRYESEFLSMKEALHALEKEFVISGPVGRYGTATEFKLTSEKYDTTIGFISSVSEPFCASCDRLRLDSVGRLFSCLRSSNMIWLPKLVDQQDESRVAAEIARILDRKNKNPVLWDRDSMKSIGG